MVVTEGKEMKEFKVVFGTFGLVTDDDWLTDWLTHWLYLDLICTFARPHSLEHWLTGWLTDSLVKRVTSLSLSLSLLENFTGSNSSAPWTLSLFALFLLITTAAVDICDVLKITVHCNHHQLLLLLFSTCLTETIEKSGTVMMMMTKTTTATTQTRVIGLNEVNWTWKTNLKSMMMMIAQIEVVWSSGNSFSTALVSD